MTSWVVFYPILISQTSFTRTSCGLRYPKGVLFGNLYGAIVYPWILFNDISLASDISQIFSNFAENNRYGVISSSFTYVQA